jgi:hypothetical protein
MTENMAAFLTLIGHDLEWSPSGQRDGEIEQHPIESDGNGCLGESSPDTLGDLESGGSVWKSLMGTIGKFDFYGHVDSLP